MARPLTKHDQHGTLYSRPPLIEGVIDVALSQDLATLRTRAALRDQKAPEFLPSECLVHLVREGRRHDNDELVNQLLPLLLDRCSASLLRRLPDGAVPNAHYIRDEVLGQFAELFATDGTGKSPDALDYYEIRFNSAFRTLRLDVQRSERARTRRVMELPALDDAEPTADDEMFTRLSEGFRTSGTPEDRPLLRDVIRAIDDLPPDERQAVVLCRVMGLEVESDDPAKTTAASLAGVTGRTIRNRLARAATALSRFKEDRR
jgi:hypothetical protein